MIKLYFISIRKRHIIFSLSAIFLLAVFIGIFGIDTTKEGFSNSFGSADSGSNISSGGKLAIIIDDFGQNRAGVKEMMSIDRHLTFAVMPFLDFSQSDAETAHKKGYEVIVHLPMEANCGKLSWVGPRPILTGMKSEDVKQIVRDAFESVPYAVGANLPEFEHGKVQASLCV